MFRSATEHCDKQLPETSIYKLLHRESHRLFADEMFADLFLGTGRNCVPPRILAVVMVLQRIEGLSDREAVDRFTFDARWKYAAGGLDSDYPSFVHTVLVNMRARLRRSQRPDRIFEVVLDVARNVIQPRADGAGNASFGDHCKDCPLRERCTTSEQRVRRSSASSRMS